MKRITVGILFLSSLAFVVADPTHQKDFCAGICIMNEFCATQLCPHSTAATPRSVPRARDGQEGSRILHDSPEIVQDPQPTAGRPGQRGLRGLPGVVNYTIIDNNIEEKFSEYQDIIEDKFTSWKNSAESTIDQVAAKLETKENELEDQIEGEFKRWEAFTNHKIEVTNASVHAEMDELESSLREKFVRWKFAANTVINKVKVDLVNKGNEIERNMGRDIAVWKSSVASEMNQMKLEIAELKRNRLFLSCEDAAPLIQGTGGVVKLLRKYEVYCDMATDGGNWIVFQRRMDGSVDFDRTWNEYASGFGKLFGDFWLGLEAIHKLTKDGNYELRIDLEDRDGQTAFAKYENFSVSRRSDDYRLTVNGYSGTAGNSMGYHDGQPFSARDKDLDSWDDVDCSQTYHAAWWFRRCAFSSLNGRYGDVSGFRTGIHWFHWRGRRNYSLKGSEMKFRKK